MRDQEREARAWLTDVASLLREPGSRRRFSTSGHLPGLAVSGSAIDDDATVTFSGRLESVTEGILATATITAPWRGACRRCLEPATGSVVTEVCELFSNNGADETYPLGVGLLDLAPLVRDACILELPLAPLCSEDCRGLCPECGVNRNIEQCACAPGGDPRWAVLASLGEPVAERTNEKGV